MSGGLESFFSLSEQDRRDLFEASAARLDTLPDYVEKDFWVCVVLDSLHNWVPDWHPRRLLKGGTSLSKAYGLIDRFSEDIDLVVFRDGLGFEGERDPTTASNMSRKKRNALFEELTAACSGYICGELQTTLARRLDSVAEGCHIRTDEEDVRRQTLFVEYPTLYPSDDAAYVAPRVRVEGGARSAVDPRTKCTIAPYVASELANWSFEVCGITVIEPERTYWEKLLVLHGLHCGFRDEGRLPSDKNRISRHYYDVAKITATERGHSALSNIKLLDDVRNHNLIAFRQAWKRFEEAVPGSVRLVPQVQLRTVLEQDYRAMQGMILGEVPNFEWVVEQLQWAETAINRTGAS